MKVLRFLFVFTFLLLSSTGCGNLLYLSKLGWHQGSIHFHSVPVQEVLVDEKIDDRAKERIHFVREVKNYGEERMGLTKIKSYSTFLEVKGPILYSVTASEKDRLRLLRWNFPIVGEVTYKGFFTREEALREERKLRAKGLDTFVQPCSAYSTLGWLRDPILSPMLRWDDVSLSNLILHEMAHGTIYFKGKTDLNEQLASFIGNRGAIDFLAEKHGWGSKEVVEAIHSQDDDLLFARWVGQACRRLSDLYSKEIPRDEKLRRRDEIFQSLRDEFNDVKEQLKTDSYREFGKEEINNAVLLAYHRYVDQLERFQTTFDRLGWDLKRVIRFFKEVQSVKEDPPGFLARWMNENEVAGSGLDSVQRRKPVAN